MYTIGIFVLARVLHACEDIYTEAVCLIPLCTGLRIKTCVHFRLESRGQRSIIISRDATQTWIEVIIDPTTAPVRRAIWRDQVALPKIFSGELYSFPDNYRLLLRERDLVL